MKFVGLVNYFQSVLAASDSDESAASFVALRDEYPCYAEAVALEMCVNATEPTDAELAICEECLDDADDQLENAESCADVQASNYCEDVTECVTDHCFEECIDEFAEFGSCIADVFQCDACDKADFAIA
uniref:Uncharacterized protein n=1 Tax=Rhizochromulina marina TaxID=1034831 RepID=A0A7S2WUC4_9STRA|mmetsp:Transcript_29360/g.61150  ORF Transcript_29360/g.61150 Transcript_29360/m.61150 type:complete len:129 (+) Transcript_29360:68-454(+)|eukprot:CAMPEP_0171341790 /NCGR_PEP_ID=MMETSP0878-20121228/11839_1 /TAXON_ID=67004 /ORGANISM="Thalassiosira weissflogii, Strain CCMP1336" /LENGTH=128 /DNA_ID=CAMNT_0011844203 /DNA_START=48 /DNA_END=434 /DNA_ORIENTATION=-